jgi:hypothetical protein
VPQLRPATQPHTANALPPTTAPQLLLLYLQRPESPTHVLPSFTAGEILPQAVCRSYGLQVGSYSALLVRLLMGISAPISWPISKLLDWILGDERSVGDAVGVSATSVVSVRMCFPRCVLTYVCWGHMCAGAYEAIRVSLKDNLIYPPCGRLHTGLVLLACVRSS